jgi:hypothetical protein
MNTSDETGEKLVQSIRKTKTSASANPSRASRSKASAGTSPATETKPVAARKARAPSKPAVESTDPYQNGRRVWPD